MDEVVGTDRITRAEHRLLGVQRARPDITPATANSDLSGKMAAIPVRSDGGIVAAE
jgi:hypothetical protein